jgi:MSHA biogenesis protein MshN
MSLINKVLRDLDARSAAGGDGETMAAGGPARAGLRPVPGDRGKIQSRRVYAFLAVLPVLLALGFWVGPRVQRDALRAMASDPPLQTGSPVVADAAAAKPPAGENRPANKPLRPAAAPGAQAPQTPAPGVAQHPRTAAKSAVSNRKSARGTGRTVVHKVVHPMTAQEIAENLYLKGVELLNQGRRDEAQVKLRAALQKNPAHAGARELLAGILFSSGHAAQAHRLLQRGIEISPDNERLAVVQARLEVDQGRDQEAVAGLEKVVKRVPRAADASGFLAALYQRQNRHKEAVRAYRQALAVQPDNSRWWLGLAISLQAGDDASSAAIAYRRALDAGLPLKLAQFARERLQIVAAKSR